MKKKKITKAQQASRRQTNEQPINKKRKKNSIIDYINS